jgi:hypothetical protein
VIEITCSTCGQTAHTQSFLSAAQQACGYCGHLLLGGSPAGGNKPAWSSDSSGGMWTGVIAGVIAAVGAVAVVSQTGRAIPVHVQGAVLGALSAVLLGPVIAVSSFISMLVLPFSLEAVFGDSVWSRLARANNERSLAPLFLPFVFLVGLPMTLGAFAGARVKVVETPLVISAGVGAVLLGAIVGAMLGSLLGGRRHG